MKRIGLITTFFALVFVVLPSLPAQDAKKKKDADAPDKKAVKDDGEKKKDKKEKDEPKKEKLVYGSKFITKVLSANGGSNREFTIETKEVDPQKVGAVQTWQAQRSQQLAQQMVNANNQFLQAMRQTNPNTRAQQLQQAAQSQANYQRDVFNFQVESAKKDIYSSKPIEVRAAEDAKVRALTPPVEFDDQGFQKKWTKKELEERKDKTGLPGFPVDFDQIKSGQYVEIYMVKPKVQPKAQPKKKKGPDDDPVPEVMTTPEFILLVIIQDPNQGK